ncbi:MAG: hypothetical protein NVS1B4_01000 [Gemmatimonadaceae bacterium]
MIRPTPGTGVVAALAAAVDEYKATSDVAVLTGRVQALAENVALDDLTAAVEPFRQMPEVAAPIYERIVERSPNDAAALVSLANAYWMQGRGPEPVSDLASRAIAADPRNRGAWHLWALAESDLRARVSRWRQVVARFPDDELAKVVLADNAASLASTESDREAWQLAITTYEQLLANAPTEEQRTALDQALVALQGWRL